MASVQSLEKLDHPPIVEAVCGVWFEPLDEIDAVLLGAYWDRVRDRFPTHKLLPAITAPGISVATNKVPPQRVWLCSEAGTTVVQIQRDRFYLNWRAGAGTYPRFSPPGGVRAQALFEYEAFCSWLEGRLGRKPVAQNVEVTKVDHVEWKGTEDFGSLLPALARVASMARGPHPKLLLKLEDAGEPKRSLSVGTALRSTGDFIIRMETTSIARVSDAAIMAAIDAANSAVNDLFASCIPADERTRRFGRQS